MLFRSVAIGLPPSDTNCWMHYARNQEPTPPSIADSGTASSRWIVRVNRQLLPTSMTIIWGAWVLYTAYVTLDASQPSPSRNRHARALPDYEKRPGWLCRQPTGPLDHEKLVIPGGDVFVAHSATLPKVHGSRQRANWAVPDLREGPGPARSSCGRLMATLTCWFLCTRRANSNLLRSQVIEEAA